MTEEQRKKLSEIVSQLSVQLAALEDVNNGLSESMIDDGDSFEEEIGKIEDVIDAINRVLEP